MDKTLQHDRYKVDYYVASMRWKTDIAVGLQKDGNEGEAERLLRSAISDFDRMNTLYEAYLNMNNPRSTGGILR